MEAVGLASSIITFIDVAYKVVRGAYEIHDSAAGATEENVHIAVVIDDLERTTAELNADPRMIADPELISLAQRCQGISADLVGRLKGLQSKSKNPLQSVAAAVRILRKQKDINAIEKRLDKYRQQIILRLILLLW